MGPCEMTAKMPARACDVDEHSLLPSRRLVVVVVVAEAQQTAAGGCVLGVRNPGGP